MPPFKTIIKHWIINFTNKTFQFLRLDYFIFNSPFDGGYMKEETLEEKKYVKNFKNRSRGEGEWKKRHRFCEVESGEGGFALKGRIWIDGPEGTFLGFGRAILLERIKEFGSISAAARSMKMAYKQAWQLVDSMNKQAGTPLVETFIGGKRGGGAKLTEAGEKTLKAFWTFYEDFQKFLKEEKKKIFSIFL